MSDDDATTEYEPSPWEPIAEHVERYLATDGDDGFEWEGAHVVILTTTGAKSGKVRRTPLIRVKDGDRYLVVASQGGAPTHPHWYHNLVANPEATVQDRAEVVDVRARVADDDEREQLWPVATEQWPDYDAYQEATDRQIPLVVLEPV